MIGTLPLVKCMSGMPVAPGVACTLTPTKRFPDAYRAFGDSCGFRSIKAFAEPQWAARSTIVVDETQQYSAAEMERMMKVQDVLLKNHGEEDHLVGGGRDPRSDRSDDAPLAGEARRGRL